MSKIPEDLDLSVRQATLDPGLLDGLLEEVVPLIMHLPLEKVLLYREWLEPLQDTLGKGSEEYTYLIVLVGILIYRETRYAEAIEVLTKLQCERGDDLPLALNVSINAVIGASYRSLGEVESALQYLQRNVPYDQYDRDDHQCWYSVSLYHIAEMYGELQNFEEKLCKHKKGLEFSKRSQNKEFYFRSLNGIGRAYQELKNYDRALNYYLKVEEECDLAGGIPFKARNLHDLGALYADLNRVGKSLAYFEQALSLRNEHGLIDASTTTLIEMGRILISEGKIAKAVALLKEALAQAEESGVKRKEYRICRLLSEAFEKERQDHLALQYYKKYHLLKDEIDNVNQTRVENQRIREMNTILEQQKELIEKQNLELEEAFKELSSVNENLLRSNDALQERTDQLNTALEANTEILGITAHDLKNPLVGVIGLAEMVLNDCNDSPQTALESIWDNVPQLKEEAERMLFIIHELLDKHQQGGQPSLKIERVLLNDIVATVIRRNSKQAQVKGIQLNYNTKSTIIVDVDELSIQRVLDNYVSNAIKYSPPEANVWIEMGPYVNLERRGKVIVSVRDEGPGLTREDKERVFGKMKRLSAKPTAGEHSSGLGLYIVKSLVEAHQGEVGVDSEYGEGATFWFILPETQ